MFARQRRADPCIDDDCDNGDGEDDVGDDGDDDGFIFFSLVTCPIKSLSLELSDSRVYQPQMMVITMVMMVKVTMVMMVVMMARNTPPCPRWHRQQSLAWINFAMVSMHFMSRRLRRPYLP